MFYYLAADSFKPILKSNHIKISLPFHYLKKYFVYFILGFGIKGL
jgi:hypothetical protein